MVHPNLQPDKFEPKWFRNVAGPSIFNQLRHQHKLNMEDDNLSNVTLDENPANMLSSEVITNTSDTQY